MSQYYDAPPTVWGSLLNENDLECSEAVRVDQGLHIETLGAILELVHDRTLRSHKRFTISQTTPGSWAHTAAMNGVITNPITRPEIDAQPAKRAEAFIR